jgi:uncharacterized protein YbjQ (UPF0145 family)
VRRAAAGGPWTSLLSAPAAAGLEVAGFDPVGEVMGSIVMQIGWSGFRGCGAWGNGSWGGVSTFGASRTVTSSSGGYVGYAPYVAALNHGYETAMGRMLEEAATIGADGVVGVALTTDHLDARAREFIALGTAVRSRGGVRPHRPFSTSLPAQDVAKLVGAGWMPTDLVFGLSVAIRHDDWQTQRQASWGSGNVEVTGYTELVNHVRSAARRDFADRARLLGADGALMSGHRLHVRRLDLANHHVDHAAECLITGTAIARFRQGRHPPTSSLTVMPLTGAARPAPKRR